MGVDRTGSGSFSNGGTITVKFGLSKYAYTDNVQIQGHF
jgi:hypothetical protein